MNIAGAPPSWSAPGPWPGRGPAANPSTAAASNASLALKAAFVFALVSLTVLDRFGLRISSSFSIHPSLIAFYALLATMAWTRSAELHARAALMYVGIVTVTGCSLVANASFDARQYASISSWMLLVVIYAPFAISLDRTHGTPSLWCWVVNLTIAFALGCAVAGILQFYAQFIFRAPWLFDFTPLIPSAIRGSGVYNTTNVVGEHVKSNGFFLREASGFSFHMAFALLCEQSLRQRKWVMATLALALVLSYSGSGLVALGVAMLFPLGRRTLSRVLAIALAGAVVVVLFGDALNISYTLGRVAEFGSDRSSAYCRFIAPGKLALEQLDSSAWTALLGHGSGTTQKMFDVCETTYGKLLFEYGLLGTLAFGSLVIVAIQRSAAPVRIRVALVVQWLLLGGNLLTADSLILIFFISAMWPLQAARVDAPEPAPS